jgi:hypothetical protein
MHSVWLGDYRDSFCGFPGAIHAKKNTHKKLPMGTNRDIRETQRIGCCRIWLARSASESVHMSIKYPKTWPKPSVFIVRYPIRKQAIRNRDKALDTHQTDFQKPLMTEIHLTVISLSTEMKMKTPIRTIFHPDLIRRNSITKSQECVGFKRSTRFDYPRRLQRG